MAWLNLILIGLPIIVVVGLLITYTMTKNLTWAGALVGLLLGYFVGAYAFQSMLLFILILVICTFLGYFFQRKKSK